MLGIDLQNESIPEKKYEDDSLELYFMLTKTTFIKSVHVINK